RAPVTCQVRQLSQDLFPGDLYRVVVTDRLLEERQELGVRAVVGQQLEVVARDVIVLILVVFFLELLDEERELLVGDFPDGIAGIDPDQARHALSLPSRRARGQRTRATSHRCPSFPRPPMSRSSAPALRASPPHGHSRGAAWTRSWSSAR